VVLAQLRHELGRVCRRVGDGGPRAQVRDVSPARLPTLGPCQRARVNTFSLMLGGQIAERPASSNSSVCDDTKHTFDCIHRRHLAFVVSAYCG
jgi:hypothetical protein